MTEIIVTNQTIDALGQIADSYAARNAFNSYQQRLDPNTLLRQKYDLALFSLFLSDLGIEIDTQVLLYMPEGWHGITYGIVEGFVQWMIQDGFAVATINARLYTVKTYFKLATKAGFIDDIGHIDLIKGYGYAEGENIDEKREITRRGAKKAQPVTLTPEQITALKQPTSETPQGCRDALLMCLLLDHGLRCGEAADLKPGNVKKSDGLLTFKREKVKRVQKHKLTGDTLLALYRYLEVATPDTALLMGSRKDGDLEGVMSRRAITKRVNTLGKKVVGIDNLSAHDCRHAWVEAAIRGKTDIKTLQDAGGWSSPAMPLRYAASAEIANAGVKLG